MEDRIRGASVGWPFGFLHNSFSLKTTDRIDNSIFNRVLYKLGPDRLM